MGGFFVNIMTQRKQRLPFTLERTPAKLCAASATKKIVQRFFVQRIRETLLS